MGERPRGALILHSGPAVERRSRALVRLPRARVESLRRTIGSSRSECSAEGSSGRWLRLRLLPTLALYISLHFADFIDDYKLTCYRGKRIRVSFCRVLWHDGPNSSVGLVAHLLPGVSLSPGLFESGL